MDSLFELNGPAKMKQNWFIFPETNNVYPNQHIDF